MGLSSARRLITGPMVSLHCFAVNAPNGHSMLLIYSLQVFTWKFHHSHAKIGGLCGSVSRCGNQYRSTARHLRMGRFNTIVTDLPLPC